LVRGAGAVVDGITDLVIFMVVAVAVAVE